MSSTYADERGGEDQIPSGAGYQGHSAGQEMGVPMPTIGLVRQFLCMLQATGRGDLDFSALLLLMEDLAGIEHKGS
jgi:hypothetical protein